MNTPYFVSPMLKALRDPATSEVERETLRMHIALNIGDPAALRELFGMDSESLTNFYPDLLPLTPSTDDTISSFLDHFASGSTLASPAAEAIAAEAIAAETTASEAGEVPIVPAVDYLSQLEQQPPVGSDDLPADETSDAISAFLSANPAPMPRQRPASEVPSPSVETVKTADAPAADDVAEVAPKADEQSPLSESLARFMIRSGNYAKALEILEGMDHSSPYLSDQIRFLRKLIAVRP